MTPTKVFIDGGGNFRKSVEKCLTQLNTHFDEIHVFEPNPAFRASFQGHRYNLVQKAIWTENTFSSFYLSKDQNQVGSSLLENKLCRTKEGVPIKNYLGPDFHPEALQVECVDFSEWLKNNFSHENYELTLKLDIEGAEYPVLWKMIEDNTISLVKNLYVEFHKEHLKVSTADHNNLLSAIQGTDVKLFDWD